MGGGNTADARARVNPSDPLRARHTLLLGSSSSGAHFSKIVHISTSRGVSVPHGLTEQLCQICVPTRAVRLGS